MKRVLIADDHSFLRMGIVRMLKAEYPNVEIMEVSDGADLIKESAKQDWDLIISDLDMPGRGGLEALEQIKIINPDVPILIISMFEEDVYAVRVLKAGAAGYITKNAAPYELINAIRRIKLGKKYITPEIAEKLLEQQDDKKSLHESLSNREFEIFKLLALGRTTGQVAVALSLALTTVSTHRHNILAKLHLSSNAELTRYALLHKVITG